MLLIYRQFFDSPGHELNSANISSLDGLKVHRLIDHSVQPIRMHPEPFYSFISSPSILYYSTSYSTRNGPSLRHTPTTNFPYMLCDPFSSSRHGDSATSSSPPNRLLRPLLPAQLLYYTLCVGRLQSATIAATSSEMSSSSRSRRK